MKTQKQPHRDDLADKIKHKVAEFYAHTEPTTREVAESVIRENDGLIRGLGYDLAKSQIHEMTARYMKSTLAVIGTGEQTALPFTDIPSAISFRCKADIRFVPIGRATEVHLLDYIGLLQEQIAADTFKLNAVKKLHDALADIFAGHPEMTVAEAAAIYQEDDDEDHGEHGYPIPA